MNQIPEHSCGSGKGFLNKGKTKEEKKMEVFIQNLKAYNHGVILGGWFKLGDTEENLRTFISEKLECRNENPSIFISTFEQEEILYSPSEFENVFQLNELVCEFCKLNIAEQEKVNAIMEAGFYYDLKEAMEHRDCYVLYRDIQSEEDFGHFLVEELETCQVPDYIKRYINYEEYGKDEIINSNGHLTMFGYLEEA